MTVVTLCGFHSLLISFKGDNEQCFTAELTSVLTSVDLHCLKLLIWSLADVNAISITFEWRSFNYVILLLSVTVCATNCFLLNLTQNICTTVVGGNLQYVTFSLENSVKVGSTFGWKLFWDNSPLTAHSNQVFLLRMLLLS